MGQQYDNQSRDCALQNRFTGYLQIALKRKKRDYIQKQLRQKTREFPIDLQTIEIADGSAPGIELVLMKVVKASRNWKTLRLQ